MEGDSCLLFDYHSLSASLLVPFLSPGEVTLVSGKINKQTISTIFNFSPQLLWPRHKTPELHYHGERQSQGPATTTLRVGTRLLPIPLKVHLKQALQGPSTSSTSR